MKANIMPALGAGFSLIAREPAAALVWGLVVVVVSVGPSALILFSAGPDFFQFYIDLFAGSSHVGAGLPPSFQQMQRLQPLTIVGALVSVGLLYPAIMRAVISPDERRRAYLRFGKVELLIVVMAVLLYIGMFAGALVGGIVLAIPVGIVAAMMIPSGGGVRILIQLLPLVFLILMFASAYPLSRLWLGAPMTVASGELKLLDGWKFTKGYGWRLVGLCVGLVLIMLVLEAVKFIVTVALAMALSDIHNLGDLGRYFADGRWVSIRTPLLAGYLAVGAVVATILQPALIAPWASVYRRISEARDDESGAVFS